jgi:phosphoribosylglycinamide formyltransferase 1
MDNAVAAQPLRLVVLISGRGSNMLAIARACDEKRLAAQIVRVLADVADAPGLAAARELGIPASAVPYARPGTSGPAARQTFEAALRQEIDAAKPDLVILAGFMRVLSADFVAHYTGRMLNIHPSLLPAYKGLHTHERALAAGEQMHGVSVHLVTAALDGGPLLAQARVPVLADDTAESLSVRVQQQEHILYPQVIQWIAEGRLQCAEGLPIFDGVSLSEPRLLR